MITVCRRLDTFKQTFREVAAPLLPDRVTDTVTHCGTFPLPNLVRQKACKSPLTISTGHAQDPGRLSKSTQCRTEAGGLVRKKPVCGSPLSGVDQGSWQRPVRTSQRQLLGLWTREFPPEGH